MDNLETKTGKENESELTKYCVYLRPKSHSKVESIESLGFIVRSVLANNKIVYTTPSLEYHITLFTFFADKKNEDEMFREISKSRYNKPFSLDKFLILGDYGEVLALGVNSKEVDNTHRFVVNQLMPYVVLKGGILAESDKSLFRLENPYVLSNYIPHITIAKKIGAKTFENNILKKLEGLIDDLKVYDSYLYVSKKNKNVWEQVNIEDGPAY